MNRNWLEQILTEVAAGRLAVDQATEQLATAEPLDYATLDHDRRRRCGSAEVIYAAGKTPDQVVAIAQRLIERNGHALVTRANADHAAAIRRAFAEPITGSRGSTFLLGKPPAEAGTPIPIVTAGTSDEPVAEEAMLTCRAMGQATRRLNDIGVAGLHRLVDRLPELRGAGCIICIAGMEGALPSVIGGLVSVPVIAVPTSVGYGAAFGGVAALLGMLTSCAAGVSVVNIDNGFGAAYTATLIQRLADGRSSE
ncbi:MAG: nickel pincer cofactor biosynthesis protein LarB [Phycisphaerales bacterium]